MLETAPKKPKSKSTSKRTTQSSSKSQSGSPRMPSKSAPKNTARTSSKSSAAKRKAEEERVRKKRRTASVILFTLSILLFFLFIIEGASGWLGLHHFIWGLFGYAGIFLPVVAVFAAYQLSKEKLIYRFSFRMGLILAIFLLFSSAVYLFGFYPGESELYSYWSELGRCYMLGRDYQGCGFFSSVLGTILAYLFGKVGSRIVVILLLFLSIMLATGSSLIKFFEAVKKPVDHVGTKVAEQKVKRQEEKALRERQKKKEESERSMYIFSDTEEGKAESDGETVDVRGIPIYEPSKRKPCSKHYTADSADSPIKIYDYSPKSKQRKQTDTIPIEENEQENEQKDESEIYKNAPQALYTPKPTEDYGDGFNDDEAEDDDLDTFLGPQVSDEDIYGLFSDSPVSPQKMPASSVPEHQESTTEVTSAKVQSDTHSAEDIYLTPPITLLELPQEENESNAVELKQNGTILTDTLKSFGVSATIVNISRGPSVTRYELQPAPGVKISKITNLADDIALNLAAVGVRIEAPIPGKSAVGIEVPNKNTTVVKMRKLIESSEFMSAKSKLTVALGYDIAGKIILADLAKMPHLLIAGSTGSGKSVCINSMLMSLLYKATPDEVKLMLIDPKVVELGVYNGIPHLLVPVVTDPRKASGALNWAVNEMLKRYNTFAECNVRDIKGYNRLVDKQNSEVDEWEEAHSEEPSQSSFEEEEMLAQAQAEISEKTESDLPPARLTKMPQIVIVIDELADLMMAAPNEVEESICRLAQMARAAGMHLVIATQRPSVDVITGLIKANVPSRIAFAVKSQVDSRTILDSGGAEKLLGRGDMLYSPIGTNKPIRVQGCFVDDDEIENVIEFLKNIHTSEYDNNIIEEIDKNTPAENTKGTQDSNGNMTETDPIMEDAIKCVVEAGQASTSLLQRRLRLGYARAGRLIDEMEQMGIVGPHEGSKPRQVLMSYQQWLERNMARKE